MGWQLNTEFSQFPTIVPGHSQLNWTIWTLEYRSAHDISSGCCTIRNDLMLYDEDLMSAVHVFHVFYGKLSSKMSILQILVITVTTF